MVSSVGIGVGTAAGVVGALVIAWHGLTWWEVDVKCEKPAYKVIKTIGSKRDWLGRVRPVGELRLYAPVLVAEVSLSGVEMREALGSGFRQIAGFIFGQNTASTKVAMTSPVTLEASAAEPSSQKIAMTSPVTAEVLGDASSYKVTFIMPSKYTKDTLPTPKNDNVKIAEIPERTMAALAWRGSSPREIGMHQRAAELRAAMKEEDITPANDSLHLWQYHPPFAPSWMRRNEVLYEVAPSDRVGSSS